MLFEVQNAILEVEEGRHVSRKVLEAPTPFCIPLFGSPKPQVFGRFAEARTLNRPREDVEKSENWGV